MATVRTWTGREARLLRTALRLSLRDFAARMGIGVRTLNKWEARGAGIMPQPHMQAILDTALRRASEDERARFSAALAEVEQPPSVRLGPVGLLDEATTPKRPGRGEAGVPAGPVLLDFSLTSDETVSATEQFSERDMRSRRKVLAELPVWSGGDLLRPLRSWVASLPVGAVPAELGDDDVQQLEAAGKLFRRCDASGVGGLQRKAVVGQLVAMTETLSESHSSAVKQRLFCITAELAQLSGWMAYDLGLHGLAQRYYTLALHACRESADAELGAKVIGDMTQLSTALGHYDDSLSFVHTALSSLPRGSNRLVRSELLGLEARACAHLGGDVEASNAARAADTCVEVFHEGSADAPPDWLHYMNRAEADCLAANTYIELAMQEADATRAKRYAARAEHYTVDACEQRGESYARSRVLDELRVGKVRLAEREPDEAASVGLRSLTLAQGVHSSVVVDWLQRFDADLHARYPALRTVQKFHDQLKAYLRNMTPEKERHASEAGP